MVGTIAGTLRAAALMTDRELLAQVSLLAAAEREGTARLVAVLGELDERKLYLGEGYKSMHEYCRQVLCLSEHAAYTRIETARAAQRFPVLLDRLADGSLHVTAVQLLARHLTADNFLAVIEAAAHKTKREIEELVARLNPQPPVPSRIQPLSPATGLRIVDPGSASPECLSGSVQSYVPLSSHGSNSGTVSSPVAAQARSHGSPAMSSTDGRPPSPDSDSPGAPGVSVSDDGRSAGELGGPRSTAYEVPRRRADKVKPLSPDSYLVQFTASGDTCAKLRAAHDLLRHTDSNIDIADVVDRALTLLVKQLEATKHAIVSRPRRQRPAPGKSRSRRIPAAVRREVWGRDGGRCAFVGTRGRCTATARLEYHHRIPFADGGPATVENIELRCRGHNAFEAERWSGADVAREAAPEYGPSSASAGPDAAVLTHEGVAVPAPGQQAGPSCNSVQTELPSRQEVLTDGPGDPPRAPP